MGPFLKSYVGLSSLFLLLAACQPIEGNSLLTDQKDESSLHTLDKTPKSEELFLKVHAPTIAAKSTDTKIEVAGECYISTYPSHAIIVMNNTSQMSILDVNPATSSDANYAVCKNGKFTFLLNIASLSSGVYNLRLILQARDSAGNVVLNEAQAAPYFTLTK